MNAILDLRPFGVNKLVNAMSVDVIELPTDTEKSYLVVLVIDGEKVRIDFKNKESFQGELDLITSGLLKL